ncbi:hypothetical protein BGZ60DRAFT_504493 [Tricladium varicosporioides]|nr:hypothetical protein BGZ60DRAFT_504493 [Hymenoscyphus varicosporioides]
MEYKNVALAGAGGSIGKSILSALIASNEFIVTVLKRPTSKATFPANVKVIEVNFNSVEALTQVLKGQDALISAVSFESISSQTLLIDAAISAGVRRFIPSNYGSDFENKTLRTFPAFRDRIKIDDELRRKVPGTGMSFTTVVNGVVIDYGMRKGAVFIASKREARVFDGGSVKVSMTRLSTIGKAVVGVLKHPKETANRAVYIQDLATTQNSLLDLAQKLTPDDKWTIIPAESAKLVAACEDLIANGADPNSFEARRGYIVRAVYSGECGALFEHLDNEQLGLKGMQDGELEAMIKEILAEK